MGWIRIKKNTSILTILVISILSLQAVGISAAADFTLLDDVNDVHHIHVHDYGGQMEVTIHVRLKGDTHLEHAHHRASEVEKAIEKCVPGAEVTVHVEPIPRDEDAN